MTSFKKGDKVLAARKQKGSEVLSACAHEAEIMHFVSVNHRGKKFVTLRYSKDLGANYELIDTIKYVPSGTKGEAATVIALPRIQKPFQAPREPTQMGEVQMTPPDPMVTSSPGTPVPLIPGDTPIIPGEGSSLKGSQVIPEDFPTMDALKAVGIDVPKHIQDRWKSTGQGMRVVDLFDKLGIAGKALAGVELTCLQEYTGESEYSMVPVKTKNKVAPKMGLLELLAHLRIKDRTMRCKSKGMMFFFLACTRPDSIVWPAFELTGKRQRAPIFSLAEQGRLVGIINDPQNLAVVSMLMKKWSRADLDAKAGAKGVEHYWNELANIFNDQKYSPCPCKNFARHVESLGNDYVYATDLVPVSRTGATLKVQWSRLRAAYSQFHARYDRSGHNEPDPMEYTNDLPTLLMHFTFHGTSLSAWAAKSVERGSEVDDAGDGSGADIRVVKRKRTRKALTTSHPQRLMAGAAMFETLYTVMAQCKNEEERQVHAERVRRTNRIFDLCLSDLEKSLE